MKGVKAIQETIQQEKHLTNSKILYTVKVAGFYP